MNSFGSTTPPNTRASLTTCVSLSRVGVRTWSDHTPAVLVTDTELCALRAALRLVLCWGRQSSIRREGKLVICLVGLPARGKTFTAFKLRRHLTWLGYKTEIFNVGNYRRKLLGAHHRHDFFNPDNKEGQKMRQEVSDASCRCNNPPATHFSPGVVVICVLLCIGRVFGVVLCGAAGSGCYERAVGKLGWRP